MRIAFNGGDAFRRELQDMSSRIRQEAEDAVAETALAIDAGVKQKIQRGQASGRIYRKSNPTRVHQASAPGQAPATDTGDLIGSIYTDIQGIRATVGSRVAYAAYLEYGTTRMAARPAWEPVVERERPEFLRRMEIAASQAIR